MVNEIHASAEARMRKAVEALKRANSTVRTGRASAGLVEGVPVDFYGTSMPLNQLATITVPEARLILIQPFDKQALTAIEKAILKANLGLTPNNDGSVVRVPVPQLTEERRREFVKIVKARLEDGKVEVRNIRRDAIEQLRALERNKETSKDESQRIQGHIQQITDASTQEMESIAIAKETEVMEV
ncbi:MAG: ribosome recycling factor [SAR202 cluster bacterium Io17-Chloro-G3]|nr:MAG: ribosome recycling factor [SAR202 cluster bacterium Io17-Chloro-G3]